MRHLLAAVGTAVFVLVAAPSVRAAPVLAEAGPAFADRVLAGPEVAYAKKGGKGWHKGWHKHKGWKRRGPPPWAPAHGLRRKRGW